MKADRRLDRVWEKVKRVREGAGHRPIPSRRGYIQGKMIVAPNLQEHYKHKKCAPATSRPYIWHRFLISHDPATTDVNRLCRITRFHTEYHFRVTRGFAFRKRLNDDNGITARKVG